MKILLTLLSLASGTLAAAEQQLAPNSFGFGREFETSEPGALFDAVLPSEVYARLTRPDLGDLRVFNSAGDILPHALQIQQGKPDTPTQYSAPFFPVYADSSSSLTALALTLRQDDTGQILNVETQGQHDARKVLVAYLVDARAITQPVRLVRIEWDTAPGDFFAGFRVEASDDLQAWRQVGTATLAELDFNGHVLSRRDINIATGHYKFLRVASDALDGSPKLSGIQLETPGSTVNSQLGSATLTHIDNPASGEFRFRLTGNPPADRVFVTLDSDNALAQVEVLSRNNDKEQWQPRGHGLIYRLQRQGSILNNPEVSLKGQITAREWLLRISPENALGRSTPSVALGFVPHRVSFVARGSGPYLLAYGATGVPAPNGSLNATLDSLPEDQRRSLTVTLGEERMLGGEQRIAAPSYVERTWKTWVLWGVLILGVLLLARMAHGLLVEMRDGIPPKSGDHGNSA
jgi:hypothetical protein